MRRTSFGFDAGASSGAFAGSSTLRGVVDDAGAVLTEDDALVGELVALPSMLAALADTCVLVAVVVDVGAVAGAVSIKRNKPASRMPSIAI